MPILRTIKILLSEKSQRTQLLLKNVAASFLIKGWSLVVQLLLVPISLDCLTNYEYGIWLTIWSILAGIETLDVGLGNGLRNKLAEAVANGDWELARRQVSNTFILMTLIACAVCTMASVWICNGDLYGALNVDANIVPNLRIIMVLLFTVMCITFVARIIGSIYMALQVPTMNYLMSSVGSTLSLVGVWILSLVGSHSLLLVTLLYTVLPMATFIGFAVFSFGHRYKAIAPSFRHYDSSIVQGLIGLGLKFFVIQISSMLLLLTVNLTISKVLSPEQLTPYHIAYRYFSVLLIPFSLIAVPIWSAATDAYSRGDVAWIRSALRKLEYTVAVFIVLLMVMYGLSDLFYGIWVGSRVMVPDMLSVAVALNIMVLILSQCYSSVLYGIGKINVATITLAVATVAFMLLAAPVTRQYGITGLVVLRSATELVCILQYKIQCKTFL